MNITDRIYAELENKHLKAMDICNLLGIQSSTVSTWKTARRNPPAEYLPQIADLLGVSLDYLIRGEEAPAKRYTTEDEDRLLELFRQLPRDIQHEYIGDIKGYLRSMSPSEKKELLSA